MREFAASGEPFGRRLYFNDGEIERICLDALVAVDCLPDAPSPVEIELFIEKRFECDIEYNNLALGVLGFAVFEDNAVVAIGAARSLFEADATAERRGRATLAHEAGHGLLHAKLFGSTHQPHPLLNGNFDFRRRRIMCRREDLEATDEAYGGKWWEWQANQAIGGLLLPRSLVEACVEPLTQESGMLGQRDLPASNRDRAVRRVAETFDVNPAVARIRLAALFRSDAQLAL